MLEDILPNLLEENISIWALNAESCLPGVQTLLDKVERAPARPIPAELRVVTSLKTPTLYIYTSGTTGILRVC